MKNQSNEDEAAVTILKSQIGFGTAFKATMGFYLAQLVATILGLTIFAVIATTVIGGLYFLLHK